MWVLAIFVCQTIQTPVLLYTQQSIGIVQETQDIVALMLPVEQILTTSHSGVMKNRRQWEDRQKMRPDPLLIVRDRRHGASAVLGGDCLLATNNSAHLSAVLSR